MAVGVRRKGVRQAQRLQQERGAGPRQGSDEHRPFDPHAVDTPGVEPVFEVGQDLLGGDGGEGHAVQEPVRRGIAVFVFRRAGVFPVPAPDRQQPLHRVPDEAHQHEHGHPGHGQQGADGRQTRAGADVRQDERGHPVETGRFREQKLIRHRRRSRPGRARGLVAPARPSRSPLPSRGARPGRARGRPSLLPPRRHAGILAVRRRRPGRARGLVASACRRNGCRGTRRIRIADLPARMQRDDNHGRGDRQAPTRRVPGTHGREWAPPWARSPRTRVPGRALARTACAAPPRRARPRPGHERARTAW